MKPLGALVAERRKARGLIQKDVAERVGMTRETYSQLETGRRKEPVTPAQALALSRMLSISMVEIINAMGYELTFTGVDDEEEAAVVEAYRQAPNAERRIVRLALGVELPRPRDELSKAIRR